MAQTIEEYIKSLNAGGSSSIVPKVVPEASNPLNTFGTYKTPSTSNAGSTSSVAPKTGTQIVQEVTNGIQGGKNQTNIPNQTVLPKTPTQVVQSAISGIQGGQNQTVIPNQTQSTSSIKTPTLTETQQGQTTPYNSQQQLGTKESADIAKNYGLSGIVNTNKYTGLTMSQAQQKAAEDKALRQGQVSQNTSYLYNPQSISNFNKTYSDMRTKLDTIKNDAFTSTQQKKSDTDATIKSYTSQFANLFDTPEQFQNALSNSPEIQKNVEEFQRAGGQLADIASAIGQKTQQNTQTLDQYLGRLSTSSEQKAYESLIPEQKAYQDQIAFEQSVPEQYKDLYFGTPERMGILEQQRNLAQEKAALLETQAQMAKDNAKAQAELLIQKNQADLDAELATTEENRLNAKNYVTGMLAKLGALNTTGAAVEGLANLEQKYQKQAQQLRTTYNLKGKEIEINMNEKLNTYESQKQEAILAVKEDLSKSEVEVAKEISKLEMTAKRETFKITDKYLSEFRSQKEKYVKEAKAQAEKNAKAAAALASTYNLSGFTFDNFLKSKSTGGEQKTFMGESITTGGQTFDPNQTGKMYPDYIQTLINSGVVSPETQEVLTGKKTITDLTEKESAIAKAELKKLGINANTISTKESKPDIESALSGARDAIAIIEDSDLSTKEKDKKKAAVKQTFIGKFPEKSATYKAYFSEE